MQHAHCEYLAVNAPLTHAVSHAQACACAQTCAPIAQTSNAQNPPGDPRTAHGGAGGMQASKNKGSRTSSAKIDPGRPTLPPRGSMRQSFTVNPQSSGKGTWSSSYVQPSGRLKPGKIEEAGLPVPPIGGRCCTLQAVCASTGAAWSACPPPAEMLSGRIRGTEGLRHCAVSLYRTASMCTTLASSNIMAPCTQGRARANTHTHTHTHARTQSPTGPWRPHLAHTTGRLCRHQSMMHADTSPRQQPRWV